jgi:hypothetical protein
MVKRECEAARLRDHLAPGARERRGATAGRTRRQSRIARSSQAWNELQRLLDTTDGSVPVELGRDLQRETEKAVHDDERAALARKRQRKEEALVDAYFSSIRGGTRSARKCGRRCGKRRQTKKRGKRGGSMAREAAWHQNTLAGAARTHAHNVAAGYTRSLVSQMPQTGGPITGQHIRALAGSYALGHVVNNHLGGEGQLAGRLAKAIGQGKLGAELNRYLKNPQVQAAAGGLAASVADILADAAERSAPQFIEAANKFVEAAGKTAEMDGVIVLTAVPPFDEIAAGGELVDIVNQDIARGERIATDGAQAVGQAEGAVEAKQAQFHQALQNLQDAVHSVPRT